MFVVVYIFWVVIFVVFFCVWINFDMLIFVCEICFVDFVFVMFWISVVLIWIKIDVDLFVKIFVIVEVVRIVWIILVGLWRCVNNVRDILIVEVEWFGVVCVVYIIVVEGISFKVYLLIMVIDVEMIWEVFFFFWIVIMRFCFDLDRDVLFFVVLFVSVVFFVIIIIVRVFIKV